MRIARRRILVLGTACALGLTTVGAIDAGSARPALAQGSAGSAAGAGDPLDEPVRGRAALRRLGSDLAEVAAVNDLSAKRLRQILRTDRTAWLDPDGRLFYVEPEARPPVARDRVGRAAALEPVADVFALHSKPGAQRVIYLDFTGHVVSGTAWNDTVGKDPWNVPAYDTDGDPSTFSAQEQAVVQEVWVRVAEDYAGFDVDVTTEEPSPDQITRNGPADTEYGTRLLIDPTRDYQGGCGCGGVAYVGVFDHASRHAYYQPALAFTQGVGTGAKNLAEVASHEVGHNLGLSHDGTSETGYYRGHGDWAPIMGVGYDEPITQWSRGEYADANNPEDDIAVMVSHGAPLTTDDHGDDTAGATPLTLGAEATGIVSERGDVDVFAVEAADGTLTVSAHALEIEPNLDIRLELLDAAGQVVAAADPPSNEPGGMSAGLSASVTAGTYFVRIDGTGFGDPVSTGYSDYGSLGSYTLVARQ